MNEFQERLQELMNDKSLSRLGLSKQININSRAIDDYFNRDFYPSIVNAIKMAKFFNCSLDYLFGRTDSPINCNKNHKSFFITLQSLLQENKVPITRAMNDMGMRAYNYYRWKNGAYPKSQVLLQIADYFDVSLDYLVGYCGNGNDNE